MGVCIHGCLNVQGLDDSDSYARFSSTLNSNANGTERDSQVTIHNKQRLRKHIEDDNVAIAEYFNSYSLQKIKALLNTVKIRENDEVPLVAVTLLINNQHVQVSVNEILRLVNSDLQDWAYGLIDDKELDIRYSSSSSSDSECITECQSSSNEFKCSVCFSKEQNKICKYLLLLLIVGIIVFLYVPFFIIRLNTLNSNLEIHDSFISLHPLTCEHNIQLFGRLRKNTTFITIQQSDYTLHYLTYDSSKAIFNGSKKFSIPTAEKCVQIGHTWTCCATFCIWRHKNHQKNITFNGRSKSSDMRIADFIDFDCPLSYHCSTFPKLLLRNNSGANIIYDILGNHVIAVLNGPKKGANSLLTISLHGHEAMLLINDTETDGGTELCRASRPTNLDPLNFRIISCWTVHLPFGADAVGKLKRYKVIRLSRSYYAIVVSFVQNYQILWKLRFYELTVRSNRHVAISHDEMEGSSWACASATDLLARLSTDRLSIIIEFITQQSLRQLQLVRRSIKIPKKITM